MAAAVLALPEAPQGETETVDQVVGRNFGTAGTDEAVGPSMSRKVVHLIGGALPAITVATLVPITIFYSMSAVAGMRAGIVASLIWAYLMLGRQIVRSRRMSGVLTITAFTLTIRCVTWMIHQSAFTYFAVPVAETVGMALLFVVTLALGRPLLVSLARDFVPAVGERLAAEQYRRIVRNLSFLWCVVYLGSAASSGVLLSTQSMHLFLLFHQASGMVWTGSGIFITFTYARRHAGELMALATAGIECPVPPRLTVLAPVSVAVAA